MLGGIQLGSYYFAINSETIPPVDVAPTDILFYKSSNGDSIGGVISPTQITSGLMDNVFDDVTATEAQDGLTEYRKIFVKNTNLTSAWSSVVFWKSVPTLSPDDEIYIGIGSDTDTDGSVELAAMTAQSQISLVSDGADTRVVTLTGELNGTLVTESVTLNSTTPVLSVSNFTKLYLVSVVSLSGSRIITVKQQSTIATLGTVGLSKYSAILYQNVTDKATGIRLGSLAASTSRALWFKRIVTAGADQFSSNQSDLAFDGETS